MRRAALFAATPVLLAGPTVLAFFAGGYFDGPRAVAAAIAWALVLLLALAGPLPLPASRSGRVALAGLVGLAAWSTISLAWAPLVGPAVDDVQRLLLYIGVLLAAVAVLREPRVVRLVEPALACGALVAIGYGLSGRLLPGVVDLTGPRSFGAGGRLEQPITYWNAEGLLAAIGFLLCVRLAGDPSRPMVMRLAAIAVSAPLGMGIYLSYSRGALAVAVVGLIVLLAVCPTWSQLRAVGIGLLAAVVVSACAAAFPGVASLNGTAGEQQRDGLIVLAILTAAMVAAASITARLRRAEAPGARRAGTLPFARRLPVVALAAATLCAAGLVAGGLLGSVDRGESALPRPSRLASLSSLRYEYWRVALQSFAAEPERGVGAGGFVIEWRKERRVEAGVSEVHSLGLEMATELGVPGVLFLGLFLGGVAASGRRALRDGAPLAAGACAVCTAFILHASIDWDWQLPAVTLPAVVLAGGLLAASESADPRSASATEAAMLPPEGRQVAAVKR